MKEKRELRMVSASIRLVNSALICACVCVAVAFSSGLARAKKAEPVWGDGTIDVPEFSEALTDVMKEASTSHSFVFSVETPKSIDKRKGKLGAVSQYLMSMASWEPDNTLPGASLCGFSIGDYGFDFQCVAKYASDEKAYAGWREVANLLTNATRWQFETRNTAKSGSLDLQTHDLRKLIGKNWREHGLGDAPDVKFTNPDSPIVIHLYLYYKCVMISIRNPKHTSDWFDRKYPGLTHRSSAGSSAANAIDEITRGAYSPLPPAQGIAVMGQGDPILVLQNGTAYGLSVYLSGPSDQTVTLGPGETQRISLVVGQYRIAARVGSPDVLPFYGVQSFSPGEYSENFYISTK